MIKKFTIITYKIKKAKRTFEYLHDFYIQLFKFYNKWYSDKKKKEENDSINHETMLSKIVCIKIIGPRFWRAINLF